MAESNLPAPNLPGPSPVGIDRRRHSAALRWLTLGSGSVVALYAWARYLLHRPAPAEPDDGPRVSWPPLPPPPDPD